MNPFPTALAILRDATNEKANAEERLERARAEVQRLLTEQGLDKAEAAGVGKVSWTQGANTKKTDWQRVAKEAGATPELIAAFTEEKPGPRTFRFTPA